MDSTLLSSLKESLIDVLDYNPFIEEKANALLIKIQALAGTHPFEEEETIDSDPDNDLLFHAIEFGSLPAVQWILEHKVMGPLDLNIAIYSTLALSSDLAPEETIYFLLENYGVDFSEVCFGDLDPERQAELIKMGLVEDDEDE